MLHFVLYYIEREQQSTTVTSVPAEQPQIQIKLSESDQKTKERIAKARKNTIKFILFTLFFYLLCRLPEMGLYIYLMFIQEKFIPNLQPYNVELIEYNDFCIYVFCELLINVVQYLYMFSYLTSFVFYFFFNIPFADAFRSYFYLKSKS